MKSMDTNDSVDEIIVIYRCITLIRSGAVTRACVSLTTLKSSLNFSRKNSNFYNFDSMTSFDASLVSFDAIFAY